MTSSRYTLLPDVALADIAFRASASSPSSLFEACARAVTDVMVDRRTLRAALRREITVSAEGLDGLLYDFLTDIIVLKDVDSLLFKTFEVEVSKDGKSLTCEATGETIDRERHKLRNDVKAVTMHMFGVHSSRGRWEATVVLDI